MSRHLGDFDAGVTIHGKFSTFRPSTGAAFTLGGTPALSVYKDGSATQSTAGVTLTVDFDSVTGLNHYAIDLSADGAFYAAGSFYEVVITTGTVDSVSVVGAVVGGFTIRKNSALKPTVAGRTFDVSAGGEGGLDWANIGSPTTTNSLTGTGVGVLGYAAGQDPATLLAASFATVNATLATIAAYVDTEVAAIKAKTDNLPSDPADASDLATSFASVLAAIASMAARLPVRPTKNTALAKFPFYMVQSSDHLTPKTGAAVTAERLLDGDTDFGPCDNDPVEVASGVYRIDLSAADLNSNNVTFRFSASGADDRVISFITQP